MGGKISKLFLSLSMIFALAFSFSNNVSAAEINLVGKSDLFTKPSDIHEDEDLLSELVVIGEKLNENLNNSCNNTNKNIHMKKGTLTHMISVIMNQCTFCMSTPFGCCFLGVVPV